VDFFDAQDNARRATRWLVVAYVVATLVIVAGVTAIVAFALMTQNVAPDPAVLGFVAAAGLLLILGATAYKTARLSSGGGVVAREMGGTQLPPDVSDPLRQRLRNVVEEMAIASGMPVPDIYVLEQEEGINAFAAGYAPGDAAIAVTRGTLERLDRDELQGVIAHEFSHVLNGDMRLGIRMMGVLFGIMVLGLLGRLILRGSYHGRLVSSRRGKGSAPALLIGLGLVVVGWAGVLVARLVKAAVSRRREMRADASAVQFTRQTEGIANALKKIAGFNRHSYLKAADPEEVSHILFARGAKFSALFATHPPIVERIRALDPSFREAELENIEWPSPPGDGEARASGFAATGHIAEGGDVTAAGLAESVGKPTVASVFFAGRLKLELPETLVDAAHDRESAWLLTLALFVDRDPDRASRGLDLVRQQLGERRAQAVARYHAEIAKGPAEWPITLLELAFPALRQTPESRVDFLLDLCQRLVELDGRLTLYEFCLHRILERQADQAFAPGRRQRAPSRQAVRRAALTLLSIVATAGHDDRERRQRAFDAGLGAFGAWADGERVAEPAARIAALRDSLDVLERANGPARRSMVDALGRAVSADALLTPREAELLRAVCASFDCPLPPLDLRENARP